MKAPKRPHRNVQKKTANSMTVGEIASACTRHARFDIAADDGLDDVEADEDAERRLPRAELRDREQGRKERRDEWADDGDVVQRKGDDAPFHRELQSNGVGEGADEQAGR